MREIVKKLELLELELAQTPAYSNKFVIIKDKLRVIVLTLLKKQRSVKNVKKSNWLFASSSLNAF